MKEYYVQILGFLQSSKIGVIVFAVLLRKYFIV